MTTHASKQRIVLTAIALAALVGGMVFLRIHYFSGAPAAAAPAQNADAANPFHVDQNTIVVPADAVATAGIQTIEVKTSDIPSTLTLSGRTDLDQERVTHVHAQFPGRVVQVGPQLGDHVLGPETPGGPTTLCTIESTDLAQAKADYLQAQVQLKLDEETLARTRELLKKQILAEKYLLDAQSAVTKSRAVIDATRQKLLVFGLTDKDIEGIAQQEGKQRMTYKLTSPRTGMVVEKGVVGGELADPTLNLFTVADTSTLWVWGDVYERDRLRVKEGQTMKVVLTSDPENARECKVEWISPVIDATTRSIKIRGSMDNRDGHLLGQMYATLVVTITDGKDSIIVPAAAVVRKGPQAFVLVQGATTKDGTAYRRTPVKPEALDAGPGLESLPTLERDGAARATERAVPTQYLRIASGLSVGQRIVRNGALGLFNEIEQQQNEKSMPTGQGN